MSRNKMIRTTMGGILLVVALAAGVSVYDIQKNKAARRQHQASHDAGHDFTLFPYHNSSTPFCQLILSFLILTL